MAFQDPPDPNRTAAPEPTIPHRYLQTPAGQQLKFYRVLEESCPACGRGPTPNKLAVLTEALGNGPETVHCTSCDYLVARRPTVDPRRLPPMNSGRR